MFQRLVLRQNAEEKGICESCLDNKKCKCKPDGEMWQYILTWCKNYNGGKK